VHLQFYKNKGIKVLGIDPARNIARIANKRGIKTIPVFFNLAFARKLVADDAKADLIYGANVLAHVPEIVDFVEGIALVLKKKGTAVLEFPYLLGLFENKFDTIYHEHVFYYGLLALQNLFHKAKLTIYDVEYISMQGGSLRIFVCHENTFPVAPAVTTLAKKEKKKGFNTIKSYMEIEKNIKRLKTELVTLLKRLKENGKKIGGYGAPAKGIILLNYFGIAPYLDFLVDKGIVKQGLYAPGTRLLVENPRKILRKEPDYLLILCWNIADEVMHEWNKFRKQGGKFILPIPKVRIL
jgi:ubiquinone/menaquinone biosynthesis C-methylase UbiE